MTMFSESLKGGKGAHLDFNVLTATGGWLSLFSVIVIIFLFASELWFFTRIETRDQVRIGGDLSLQFLRPDFDITFPKIPCAALGVNMLDGRFANIIAVNNMILMYRLDANGNKLPVRPLRDSLRDIADSASMALMAHDRQHREIQQQWESATTRCSNCFAKEEDLDMCCQKCSDIENVWKDLGRDLAGQPWIPAQCAEDHKELPPLPQEGCRIVAQMDTRVLHAHLNIGINYFYNHDLVHPSVVQAGRNESLDFTHTFNYLRWGEEFPTRKDDLQGHIATYEEDGYKQAHFLYDLNVIPLEYTYINGDVTNSAVYSLTKLTKSTKQNHYHLPSGYPPGVRMHVGVPAFTIYEREWQKSWKEFVCEMVGVLGGIFAFTTMLDAFLYRATMEMKEKQFRKIAKAGSGALSD